MARVADHPIEPWFLERWSPRAMSGAPVEQDVLSQLFEAARWAPSSGNSQPWRFLYAKAGTPQFGKFFELLMEGNRSWCQRAGALLVVVSKHVTADGKPARTNAFDTGAAWMSLALQGSRLGLVIHGMGGFDYERARADLRVPDTCTVQCMVAVGYPGRTEDLLPHLVPREQPNGRNASTSFVAEGDCPAEFG
jgi:nitroreductase